MELFCAKLFHMGHPCLTPMLTMSSSYVSPLICALCKLWYTWLSQLVVNDVVHLSTGGVPRVYHVKLCQKFFLKLTKQEHRH